MPRRSDGSDLEQERLRHFGERIRQLRAWRGLSQSAIATRAGLSRDFVAKVEQGRVSPGLLRIWELADALDVAPADLFVTGLPAAWQTSRTPSSGPPAMPQ